MIIEAEAEGGIDPLAAKKQLRGHVLGGSIARPNFQIRCSRIERNIQRSDNFHIFSGSIFPAFSSIGVEYII